MRSMSRTRTTLIGGAVGALLVLGCLASAAGVQWYEEGREIAICNAARDFWDQNERAPSSLVELPAPASTYTATRQGRVYAWSCSDDGGAPSCGLSWAGEEPGTTVGRTCGRLDQRDWADWF